ncbi:MAG: 3-deoxy-D-manno-octulosonic acid transferase [Verrucomicrobia bacterium]|nr:3-deoxy-D-manno-octulosonic acid transferase [Verrucomicrobiota bacterium]
MILLYRLVFIPLLLLAMPYYGLRMWRRGGYGKDFKHRLGFFPRLEPCGPERKRVWLQAVSVGEVLAVGPLIESLQKSGQVEVVLTTTTSTGYAAARERYKGKVAQMGIFPFDFCLCSSLAWRRIRPDAVMLMESELWPEHLHQAQTRGVPAILINARMSDRSFRRYMRVKYLAERIFAKLDHIYTSSERDQQRILELGGDALRVTCAGNVKFDAACPEELSATVRKDLREALGFENEAAFVLLGSSTWPGEETALLAAQAALRATGVDCRLLLVPRHAERGRSIAKELDEQALTWHQRSVEPQAATGTMIYLADTTGELSRLAQVADLVFIGKSLAPNEGGQNPIEAAALGLPMCFGPHMSNFKDVARALSESGAARLLDDAPGLQKAVLELAGDSATRAKMGAAGRAWHSRNGGSSERIAEGIRVDLRTD